MTLCLHLWILWQPWPTILASLLSIHLVRWMHRVIKKTDDPILAMCEFQCRGAGFWKPCQLRLLHMDVRNLRTGQVAVRSSSSGIITAAACSGYVLAV